MKFVSNEIFTEMSQYNENLKRGRPAIEISKIITTG